jgi:hypothetical protein
MKKSTLDAINRYAKDHCPVGGFLYAILSNNLTERFAMADEENKRDIEEILQYCYWNIPAICWKTPEKVEKWLNKELWGI